VTQTAKQARRQAKKLGHREAAQFDRPGYRFGYSATARIMRATKRVGLPKWIGAGLTFAILAPFFAAWFLLYVLLSLPGWLRKGWRRLTS
jgi:hypothetical protein